jgi:thiol-disulfide isomerase/thioredoxin
MCSTELPAGASFCPQCGNPVSSTNPFTPQPTHSGSNIFVIALFLIGLVLLAAAILFPSFSNNADSPFSHESVLSMLSEDDANFKAGSPLDLYGKTLDDKDFDWASLRGKYVLVKFTATWCGPCKGEIPGMLDAYEKYHDKGLEIVSIYVWERGQNSEATVKQFVEKEKLPWIIVSESLTEKSGLQPQSKTFNIQGVPTMLLVDKEGKILTARARGGVLKKELEKLFAE